MVGWAEFIAAFAVFFASHSLPLRPPVRAALVARFGTRAFGLGYSALSLAVLVWLIVAAGRAPYIEVWPRAGWQTWVPLLAMALACAILALALGRPNPFSFGGGAAGFDPARPGIIRLMRHPVLVALGLWAAGHMVPNGDLAHVLLFGVFAGFAVLGRRIIDRRKRRQMGPESWQALQRQVANAPLPAPRSWAASAVRLGLGVIAYAALIVLHPVVIGVPPLP